MCWQGASSTTTGRRQGSRVVRRGGRGAPDARRILVSKTAETRGMGASRLCLFLCLHCGGRALGAPRPARTPLPLAGERFVGFGGYQRVASWERALGESSAPHGSTSPGEKAFRRIRGISKNSPTAQAALWERPAPHEPRFPWREGVLLGSGGIEGSRVGGILWEGPAMHDSLKRKRA